MRAKVEEAQKVQEIPGAEVLSRVKWKEGESSRPNANTYP